MKTILLSAASAATLAMSAAAASPVPLDFQTLLDGVTVPPNITQVNVPVGDPSAEVGTAYAPRGVVFSSDGEDSTDVGPTFGIFSGFLAPGNIVVEDFVRGISTFNIRMDFAAGTSFVSGDIIGPQGDEMTGTAFDDGGNVLDTFTTSVLPAAGASEAFLLTSAGPLISYVVVESATSPTSSGVAVDNLDFDQTPIPIPAAGILFAGGALGAGFLRRRKKP